MYDSSVHGELFIAKNILNQLSCLGSHIRKSMANVQRSANTSKVVSIETEDLTVDPVWRVPVLIKPKLNPPANEACESRISVPDEPPLASPERSPSPLGQSLWSLARPPDRSSPHENIRTKASQKDHTCLRRGRRPPRWKLEEDAISRKLKTSTKLAHKGQQTLSLDKTEKASEQMGQGIKMKHIDGVQSASAKSSSPCSSLSKMTEPGLPTPVTESINTTISMRIFPAMDTSTELLNDGTPLQSSHNHQSKMEEKRRRAAHARRAYQSRGTSRQVPVPTSRLLRLADLETALPHRELPGLDQDKVDGAWPDSRTAGAAKEHLSPRCTKRGRRIEAPNPTVIQESRTEASLTIASPKPISSCTGRRVKSFAYTPQLRNARQTPRAQSFNCPGATVAKISNGNLLVVDNPPKSLSAEIESENSQPVPIAPESSNKDIDKIEDTRFSTHNTQEMCLREVSVMIVRQDNSYDSTTSDVLNAQSSGKRVSLTQGDIPTSTSNPPARRGRSQRSKAVLESHISQEALSTSCEFELVPQCENQLLDAKCTRTPALATGQFRDSEVKHSEPEISRKSLSSSPDPMTMSTQQSRGKSRISPTSKQLRKSIIRKRRRKPVTGKRVTKSIRTADSPSLTSMLGRFSDDELCHTPAADNTALTNTPPATPTMSSIARQCGLAGHKCDRALCLTCN